MWEPATGRVIEGEATDLGRSVVEMADIAVDQDLTEGAVDDHPPQQTTLGAAVSVTGPGTFLGKAQRTLTFEPSSEPGWQFDRVDLPDAPPIPVSVHDVWTTVRNVVLRRGADSNYMRMVEHIIALRSGMGLDNVMIRMESGDPPLFDRSSMDLVEAIDRAGIITLDTPAKYITVKEPVTAVSPNGGFLTFLPALDGDRKLYIDCAVAFKSAIGKQRIRFVANRETFRYGAQARTNTTLMMMMYVKTIGKLFADVRSLGYSTKNILIAGRWHYFNRPNVMHNGKSLEAVWHRATLDLLAGTALLHSGRFAGTILSYKAGHALDVRMGAALYKHNLLEVMS